MPGLLWCPVVFVDTGVLWRPGWGGGCGFHGRGGVGQERRVEHPNWGAQGSGRRVPHSLRILQRVRFLNFPPTPFILLNKIFLDMEYLHDTICCELAIQLR
jgi:hypothetical protein